jgi:hypothetical protein
MWNFVGSFRDTPGASTWNTWPEWHRKHGYYTAGCGKVGTAIVCTRRARRSYTVKPSVSMSNTDCLAPSARASLVNIQRYPGSPRPFFDFAALSPRRPGELRPPIVDRRCLRWIFWPGQLPTPVFSAHENTRMSYPSVGQSYFPRPRDARGRKDTARNCREGYLCSVLDRCWLC